ncbi:MAG TPA: hypothetical protein VMT61_14270 [Candidatus Binataceae bacterium]|nr:hypothetical protein [Candidatus Binataceae bacterium]
MSLHHIRRSVDDSLGAVVPYGAFLDDEGDIDLRGWGTMRSYGLRGFSPESTSSAEIAAASIRLAAALGQLGTNDMLHVIYHRLPATNYPERALPTRAAQLIDAERRAQFTAENYWLVLGRLYLTHQHESALAGGVKAKVFASGQTSMQPRRELMQSRTRQLWANFEDAAADTLDLQRLTPQEIIGDLALIVTGKDYAPLVPAAGVRLNEIISSERWYGGVAPWVGELHMRPVCITAYPAATVPQMLAGLLRHTGRMTLSIRFISQDAQDTQEQLQLERTYWVRAQLGSLVDIVARALNIPRRRTINQDVEQQIAEVDGAIAAAAGGLPFGWCTITAIIYDTDADRATLRARDLVKDCYALGLPARLEDANAAEAIMGAWPGNGWSNVRRPIISAGNFADLILPVTPWPGTPSIDSPFYAKGTSVPLICAGSGREPFYPPSHLGGVANQLIIGPTGAGKSAYLGLLAAATTGLTGARIAWLDLDYSSFVLAHALGADYRELAADGSSPLCPLAHLDDADGLGWVLDWFMRLFARWPELALDETAMQDLTRALELAQTLRLRTLTLFAHLLQHPRLRAVLSNYITGGKWGHIFDGDPATAAAQAQVTIYELPGLLALGECAAAPATELILHEVEVGMGTAPTFIYVDEAWRMLSDEVSRDWLYAAIRTFRKRNAGITLATQSLTEIANSPYRDLLLESCPGKIFLPNPDAKGAYVREAYLKLGLAEREIELIANATPRRQYYFHSRQGRRLFSLDLGPVALALCAATGHQDVTEARELLDQCGADNFLDAWLQARGLGETCLRPHETATAVLAELSHVNGTALHD